MCSVILSQLVDAVPVEILELILLRYATTTFAAAMTTRRSRDRRDDVTLMTSSLAHLASVSYGWYMAVSGWPCSDTRKWFRHTVRRLMNSCERHSASSFLSFYPVLAGFAR